MRKVELTDEELLLLDGKVGEKAQGIVEQAKLALQHAELGPLGSEVLRLALEQGEFKCNYTSLRYCGICKKSAGYAKFKGGRNRGQDNHKRPLYFSGIEFMPGFITMRGYASNGGCKECVGDLPNRIWKYIVEKDLPIQGVGADARWAKENLRKCKSCGAEFGEFDMYIRQALMGDGWLHAGCPSCEEQSSLFHSPFESTGHRMVRTDSLRMLTCKLWTRRESYDLTVYDRSRNFAAKKAVEA